MTPEQEAVRLQEQIDRCPDLACDYPSCIGGECQWECERNDKHKKWLVDELADVNRAIASRSAT